MLGCAAAVHVRAGRRPGARWLRMRWGLGCPGWGVRWLGCLVLGGVCRVCGGGERTDMPLVSAFFDTKTTMPSVLSTCIVGTKPLH